MAIKFGQLIEYRGSTIDVSLLPHGSSKKVICICDSCGKEKIKTIKQYYNCVNKHGKYYCKECFNKNKKLLEEKAEKTKQTCFIKYGETNPMKNEVIKDKLKNTLIEEYGVEYAGQIKEGREKRKRTCLEKYGVENPVVLSENNNCHNKQARQKAVNTTRKLHGGIGFEKKENREKARKALLGSGKIPTSSQQKKIYNLLNEIYPDNEECILNKPLSELALDISLKINGILIDIEVDGKYWHQNPQKDRARDEVVKEYNYKVLRIKFQKNIPSKEELKEALEKLIHSDHTYNELIVSDY